MKAKSFATASIVVIAFWVVLIPSLADPREIALTRKPFIDNYLAYARYLKRDVLRPDLCPYDSAAVVMEVGRDPEALVRFVREKIAYEPYLGSVRGPEGTLVARAGSDWDRAALLRALLTEIGFESRLKVIDRTDAERRGVVALFLRQHSRARTLGAGGSRVVGRLSPPSPFLQGLGLTAENRDILLSRANTRWQFMLDEAYDAGFVETPWIERALGDKEGADGKPLLIGQPFGAWQAELGKEASERVLVELLGPEGSQLLDIGPNITPVESRRLGNAKTFTKIPNNRVASVTLRLYLFLSGEEGARSRTGLMEENLVLENLFRLPIRLEIVPYDEEVAKTPPNTWETSDWYEHLSRFEKFQAVFQVGKSWSASRVFDLNGRLYEVTAEGRIESTEKMGETIRRGLTGMFGGEEGEAETKTDLESVALEIELSMPGRKPIRQQRLLFGRMRPNVSPVYSSDILVVPGPVGPLTTMWLMLDVIAQNAQVLDSITGSDSPGRFKMYGVGSVAYMPRMLHEWQLGRLALADRILSQHPLLTLMNGPAVAMETKQFLLDAEKKTVIGRSAVDVVWDEMRFVPSTAEAVSEATRQNLILGVASTVFESILLREGCPSCMIHGAFPQSQLFQLKKAAPVVRPPTEGPQFGQAKPGPLAAWAIAQNESHRLVVFPRTELPACWWSIDPATGAVIGRGDGGEGQSAMEYLQITKMNIENLLCFLKFQQAAFSEDEQVGALLWLQCMAGITGGGVVGAGGGLQYVEGYHFLGRMFGYASNAMAAIMFLEGE